MPSLAYINGKFMPMDQATVPINDRGYQFADAVYEVISGINGRLFCLDAHFDRLERSMRELDFPFVGREGLREILFELIRRSELKDVKIYIQISRGVAPRLHEYDNITLIPQIIMTIRQAHPMDPEKREQGVSTITVPDIRWGRCDIKTTNLLPNVMAKQKALAANVYDAIFVSSEGYVREATSSNVFVVKSGKLITHPLTPNILPGITRKVLLALCEEIGLTVWEDFFTVDTLYGADEIFLSGTITEVLPVVEVDGRSISGKNVGPYCKQLYKQLRSRMLCECQS